MNILIATDYDNGGQMIALKKALCKYTEHKARLITYRETYLKYETDILNPTPDRVSKLAGEAEFFIFGELLYPNIQTMPIIEKVDKNNCIIRAGGTVARTKPGLYGSNIMKTGGFHDPTLVNKIFPMALTVNMYDFDSWPNRQDIADYPVKLVFSGTAQKHRKEHSGIIFRIWKKLSEIYTSDKIEFVNIKGQSWLDTLAIKSGCHICFDQFLLGTYGSSAIEGMYYELPVFGFNSPWSKMVFPDVPIISILDEDELLKEVRLMIEDPTRIGLKGVEGHTFVMRTHHSKIAIQRWVNLIEHVSRRV